MALPKFYDWERIRIALRQLDEAHPGLLQSVVLIGGGAALIAGGIVRYVTHDTSPKEARQVGVVPTSGGGLITLTGAF